MWEPKTPYLTTDGIVECYNPDTNTLKGIALIKRKNPPYGLALPGGFVDRGETIEAALSREMQEELNISVTIKSLLGIYSDPARDPRFHTASAVYIVTTYDTPKAGDDAKEVYIYPIEELPLKELVFDHAKILQQYLEKIN